MSERVGVVDSLWRYPVKSMRGEAVQRSWADERGLLGDRAFAVVDDATGKIASAKNPRLWKRMLECRARYVAEPTFGTKLPLLEIHLPSGDTVLGDDANGSAKLSEFLGRPVQLLQVAPPGSLYEDYWPDIENLSPEGHRDTITNEPISRFAPAGTFFDMSAFHLVTQQALDALGAAAPASQIGIPRFRPNLVIQCSPAADGFPENAWVGRTLRCSEAIPLKILMPTMRCVMTTLAQLGFPADPRVLRALVESNMVPVPGTGQYPCIGVYASLARKLSPGGVVMVGDECDLV